MADTLFKVNSESNLKILELDAEMFGATRRIHPVLLWDRESAILIDAGFPGNAEIIQQAVEAAGVPFSHIRRIFISHHDWDHIGALPELIGTNPAIEVFSHPAEKPYIEGTLPSLKLTPQKIAERIASLPPEFRSRAAAVFTNLPAAPVHRLFNDGDILPLHGGIHVIHTPGHTPGHVCFFLPQLRLLIAGDQLRVEEGALVGPSPEFTPDLPTALVSLKKLLPYDIERVLCYHGGLYGPGAAIRIAELANESA